ncbi:hypothetical protein Taro_009157 [Colocasia esculenta]|uniref:Mitochondrial glycoprotein n=1 Tax=Colocasia esculenta TaxID=4460 RepID=A0A843TZK0_COLES|nr:hypothetical protein [Colocasia esculenta]
MASTLLRRGFRLPSSSALLLRQQLQPSRLPQIASSSSSRVFGPQTKPVLTCARFAPSARFASFAADKSGDVKLRRVLDSEIEYAEQDVEGGAQDESTSSKNFPFTIIDNPGDQTITLKREFGNETIEASVFLGPSEGEAEEDDQDNEDGTDNEADAANLSDISLVVAINKGSGPTLEFCCSINPQEINIDSLALKSPENSDYESPYEGPEFTDLDEALQKEFHDFLARRGIKPSLASFLQDYMVKKEEREYLTWLKNMKEFVEK